jgi:hypothetical protein
LGFAAIMAAAEREKARVPTAELKATRDAGAKAEVTANMVDVTRVVAFIISIEEDIMCVCCWLERRVRCRVVEFVR